MAEMLPEYLRDIEESRQKYTFFQRYKNRILCTGTGAAVGAVTLCYLGGKIFYDLVYGSSDPNTLTMDVENFGRAVGLMFGSILGGAGGYKVGEFFDKKLE